MNIVIGADPTLGLPVANLNNSQRAIGREATRNSEGQTFMDVLTQSLNKVSDAQNEATALGQLAITNPDSVNVHEITTAMAKANMSLTLAKTVIDRSVTGFKEILNQR